ncbi:MAG: hypothetical protein BroJett018_04010 [Chloroflexota bacterium]|nr:DUF4058 family protein [Chloroflexota bacterium]NOG61804.1 DUF4058 family protein [Chloroflexota bacterium]GIK62607.1 MAG: hypothetical protein BroJett018_04010 [Chloroflexota bacterium]
MPIRSRINQYWGINAHFQSYAQHERDGWVSFHNTHITHLCEAIDRLLPPGYEVVPERSLQIRMYDPLTGKQTTRRPEPDITIWDTQPYSKRPSSSNPAITPAAPVATKPLLETMTLQEETRLKAVLIREIMPDGEAIPVTRIELISPANKIGEERLRYLAKRDATLESGTVLVEVDYIHELDSIILGVPSYARRDADSYPYTIIVSDPRPTVVEGQARIFGFHVDEPIPPIEIPLADSEHLLLNFVEVYNRTFSSLSAFATRADYAHEPIGFETYHPTDQLRIWGRMIAVVKAEKEGRDLLQGPFPAAMDEISRIKGLISEQVTLLMDDEKLNFYWLVQTRLREETSELWLLADEDEKLILGPSYQIQTMFADLKSTFENHGYTAFSEAINRIRQSP